MGKKTNSNGWNCPYWKFSFNEKRKKNRSNFDRSRKVRSKGLHWFNEIYPSFTPDWRVVVAVFLSFSYSVLFSVRLLPNSNRGLITTRHCEFSYPGNFKVTYEIVLYVWERRRRKKKTKQFHTGTIEKENDSRVTLSLIVSLNQICWRGIYRRWELLLWLWKVGNDRTLLIVDR